MSLKVLIEMGENIWLVSDGGLDDATGYFGWVIASDRQILWRNRGHVQGERHLLETLRTESVGLLSMLVFLKHYSIFHNVTLQLEKCVHYCDNMSVVQRIHWAEQRSIRSPSECIQPDADVQLQIEALYQEMGDVIKTHHVKGHQDDKGPGADKDDTGERLKKLSWEARLNIQADKLATKCRREISQQDLEEPQHLFPACQAHLKIDGVVITRSIKEAIREAWNTKDLRKHYNKKHKWTNQIMNTIDWEVSGRLLTRMEYYQHRFVVRYINNRLPLRGEKFMNSEDILCPCCGMDKETAAHFRVCNQNIEKWEEVQEELSKAYKTYNVDPMLRILINRIVHNKDMSSPRHHIPIVVWKRYRTLCHQQQKIGWCQILLGRWALEWNKLQRLYCKDHGKDNKLKKDNELWLGTITQIFWNHARLRWYARNNSIFKTKDNQYKTERTNLLHRIESLYSRADEMQQQDRKIFGTALEKWKEASITNLRRWIKCNQPFITEAVRRYRDQIKLRCSDIRTYFAAMGIPDKRLRRQKRKQQRGQFQHNTKNKGKGKKEHAADRNKMDLRRIWGWNTQHRQRHKRKKTEEESGISDYFKNQDRPPDNTITKTQMSLHDFMGKYERTSKEMSTNNSTA